MTKSLTVINGGLAPVPKKTHKQDLNASKVASKRQSGRRGKSPTNNPLCNAIRALFQEAALKAAEAAINERDHDKALAASVRLLTLQDCALMMDYAAIQLAGKLQA